MKLSNITIFKDREWPLSPFTIEVMPSEKTKSFLFKLLNDQYFIKTVKELRLKYSIPIEGFSAKLLHNYKQKEEFTATKKEMKDLKMVHGTYDIQPLWSKMKGDIKKLVAHFNYGFDYIWLFFLLVTHNTFIEYNPKEHLPIHFDSGKDLLKLSVERYSDPVAAIFLKSNVTKNDLIKWINKNWETIVEDDQMIQFGIKDRLAEIMPKIPVERGTLKNLKIDEKILELLNKNNTNKQIFERLMKYFPDDDKIYGQEWVNLRISRLKKKLNLT